MSCRNTEHTNAEAIGYRSAAGEIRSQSSGDNLHQTDLSVPTIHCGGCVQRIERTLSALPNVAVARVNLSTSEHPSLGKETSPLRSWKA